MTAIGGILLGMFAGWLVTFLADTIPARRALHPTWTWPIQRFGLLTGTSKAEGEDGVAVPPASRYLLVWLAAMLLGCFAFGHLGWTPKALLVALEAWFFLTIAVIDLEHRLVLNRMLLPAVPLILVANLALGETTFTALLFGAAAGFGLFLALALLSPGGMGMGDVKLAGLIGLTTGLSSVLAALLIAILIGGMAGALILLNNRFRGRRVRGQTMAYAPYLVMGVWIVLFDGIGLLHTYLEHL